MSDKTFLRISSDSCGTRRAPVGVEDLSHRPDSVSPNHETGARALVASTREVVCKEGVGVFFTSSVHTFDSSCMRALAPEAEGPGSLRGAALVGSTATLRYKERHRMRRQD
jgi:hypothetical protein